MACHYSIFPEAEAYISGSEQSGPRHERILVKPGRTASMREAKISDIGKILDLYRMKP